MAWPAVAELEVSVGDWQETREYYSHLGWAELAVLAEEEQPVSAQVLVGESSCFQHVQE